MASSPAATTSQADDFGQTLAEMGRTPYNTGRKVRISLPTVTEASSIDSVDGGAPLVPRTNNEPFAALRSQTQSAHNSPATSASDGSETHKPSSQLSDPTDLKSNIGRSNDEMNLAEKLARAALGNTPKLNPATAEFRPVAADQAPVMFREITQAVNSQNQDGRHTLVHEAGNANGMKNFQPQTDSSFNPPANSTSTGYNTFQPQTNSFASMAATAQAQQYMPSLAQIENTGMNCPRGMTYGGMIGNGVQQRVDGINRTGGMAFDHTNPNAFGQQPQIIKASGGIPHGSGSQQSVNGINGRNGTGFGTYYGNDSQLQANGMNQPNGMTFGVPNASVVQQTGNGINGMPMANGPVQNGTYNGMNGAVGMNSSTQDQLQLSMNTLQAHLSGMKQNHYPQAGSDMKPTFPQIAVGQSQSIYQPQNGLNMQQQQHGMTTPMRNGITNAVGQYTPASSTNFTPTQYMGSPANGRKLGQTEPPNFAPRSNGAIRNEPPPRFALQTPVPTHQQVYSNVISPSSAGGDPFSPSGPGPIVDPFNGPALPRVIRPIELPQNALVLHDNPVPDHIRNMRSKQLNELTQGPTRRPSLEVALSTENFPFVESARNAQPTNTYGVIKLKNIPFSTKRSEILAFLGRNSKVLNDNQEPVHIIMERVTSKTNDAYVEFMSMQAAVSAVEKHQKTVAAGRLSRLGDRPIEVELSSQSALMKDLFPLAKGVRWDGAFPVVLQDHPTEPWNCFKGFVTEEEMSMLVKHVEIPQRSPFSRDCPQRPFECMISMLRKFPWYKTECITIKQRYSIYNACIKLLRNLQHAIRGKKNDGFLTEQLFRRLWTAAMLCHGFTVTMKDNIAFQVELPDDRLREFNMPRFANMWVHSYTLAPKPGTPLDVLEWYIALIREETHRTVGLQLPNIQAQIHKEGALTSLYWGFYYKELNLPHGPEFDNMTLAQMADLEFGCITNILSRALSV
ncbi:hypothetical protein VP1G_04374 [Cytospora mali]|uniref:RRM domain-containing protein n=1 Tax=Cytospora mali TaxID=578113 RepID=A0A194UZG0_CYTMA|nr:hypothetical protein VP1G_04374 [Valsa mali var. pyri (nom. inval.)]